MRHLKSGRKLNRTASHRKAMLSNLATSLLDKERVTTTTTKAKEVRSVVERLITYGKKGTLHAVRLAAKRIQDKTVLKKLFDTIAPGYKGRQGGYTRIVKLRNRKGDNAELAIIELVGRPGDEQRKRKKKKKAHAKKAKAPVRATAEKPVEDTEKVVTEATPEKSDIQEAPKKKSAKSATKKKKTADKKDSTKEEKVAKVKKESESKARKGKKKADTKKKKADKG